MFNENTYFVCPNCNALVGQNEVKCSGCGFWFTDSGLDIGKLTIEQYSSFLSKKREVVSLEDEDEDYSESGEEHVCSICGKKVAADDFMCPHCGALFLAEEVKKPPKKPIPPPPKKIIPAPPKEIEEIEISCPICGARVSFDDPFCPKCGVEFSKDQSGGETEKAPESVKITEIKQPVATPKRPPEIREKTKPSPVGKEPGFINGLAKKGRVNGLRSVGRTNGLVNGLTNGLVNGVPSKLKSKEIKRPERSLNIFGIKLPLKLVAAAMILILAVASVGIFLTMQGSQTVLLIDGQFEDWTDISSYDYSLLEPYFELDVDVAKIARSSDSLFLYLSIPTQTFSSSEPSAIYAFIDSDRSRDTGYSIDAEFGAEQMIVIDGWNGITRSVGLNQYQDASDLHNWSSWSPASGISWVQTGNEIEIECSIGSNEPYVKLVRSSGTVEQCSPTLSLNGTIVAMRTAAQGEEGPITGSQPVMTVSMIGMGMKAETLNVQPYLIDQLQNSIPIGPYTVSSQSWTDFDISTDLTSISIGSLFQFDLSISSTGFFGTYDMIDCYAIGYRQDLPGKMVVDGILCDWSGLGFTDSDMISPANKNIDITEYGATTQEDDHFFFVRVDGKALWGSNVPEKRKIPEPGGGGSPIIKLRKTGEDLLQAYIDRDPWNATGILIESGLNQIHADYLIQMTGRHREIHSQKVYEWSENMGGRWMEIGLPEEIALSKCGIEFSVQKALLGNLTSSEIIFAMTDWQESTDDAYCGYVLMDPWAMLSTGVNYRSGDGITWYSGASLSLSGSDTIVDIVANPTAYSYVFSITNTGRTYYWQVGTSSAWSGNCTDPISGVNNIVAISIINPNPPFNCIALTADGMVYQKYGLTPDSQEDWSYTGSIDSQSDFTDIIFRAGPNFLKGELYVIRSASNSNLYYTNDGGSTWSTVGVATGSSNAQSHIEIIKGSQTTKDKLYVLTENGQIRYTTDGGSTWSNLGNLPTPGGGNSSKYVSIAKDTDGNFWTITDTGWCFKSTDSGSTWTYTGRPTTSDIIALAAPIPEFESVMLPVVFMFVVIFVMRRYGRIKREAC